MSNRATELRLRRALARLALPLVGGFGTACSAIEGMLRTLAAEVGPKGVRVCWAPFGRLARKLRA